VRYLEGELDPKERGLLEREWNAMFRGPKNAGKVKVTDFRYEIDKVGWTPQELRFNEGEDWIMKKICGAFPVPIGLVDTAQISRAPRAGMEGADLFMAQFNTLPRCTLVEEKLNEQLCPMYDGERLFLAFDNPVPKDKREQLNEDSVKLNSCVITVNEVRQRDGEEPVPWGDTPIPLQQAQAAAQQFAPLGGASQVSPEAGASTSKIPGKSGIQAISTQENEGGFPGGALFGKKEKGGPGSGSWEGPGDPRFAKEGEAIPIRLADSKERAGGVARRRGYNGIPEKEGFEVVYKPYGNSGNKEDAGYYYAPLKKSLSEGMSMEVDGQYISPSLAGIPVKLRVRNEGGRFDRRGVGRLRASREVVESLKGGPGSGSWEGPGDPRFAKEGNGRSDLWSMDQDKWNAHKNSLKTPDGKRDNDAIADAIHEREKQTEEHVVAFVTDHPKTNTQVIGEALNIPLGRVSGALNRSVRAGKLSVRELPMTSGSSIFFEYTAKQ
jgi:hypothetical protein